MRNPRNKNVGFTGEELASKYLISRGFKVIERNFKKRYTEIDIVGIESGILVFVEVKTRLGNKFGTPQEAITPWKIKSLIRSAQYYKLLHPDFPDALRIDVVSVSLISESQAGNISWYKNVTG